MLAALKEVYTRADARNESHSDNSDSVKLCKRWANRKVRRAKEALSRGLYKRLLDMWWMLD